MTISAVPPGLPAPPTDPAASQVAAAPATKPPFEPAPALRPTIQDEIDITRALMLIRGVPLTE